MAKHNSDAKKKKQAVKRAEYKAARNAKYKQAKNKKLHQTNHEAVRSETREVVSKKIDSGIRGRFGLPKDCEVFRVPQFGHRKIREVTRGTVVLVNLAANKLICVVRFNHEDPSSTDPSSMQLWEDFRRAIRTMHLHAEGRGNLPDNHAVMALPEEERQGKMRGFGFRSTRQAGKHKYGKKISPFAQNSSTSSDFGKLKDDEMRQDDLPWVHNFQAERTSSLCLHAYESNREVGIKTCAPSWASREPVPGTKEWTKSPNGQVFVGSSTIVTSGGFRNAPHCDYDATGFASGFFCLIDAYTSNIISPERRMALRAQREDELLKEQKTGKYVQKEHPEVGAQFIMVVGDFEFKIDINAADLVELIWATDVNHYTSHALFSPEEQKKLTTLKAAITRQKNNARTIEKPGGIISLEGQHVVAYASCSQITSAVVQAMNNIMDMRGDMDDEAWERYHPTIAGTYDEQLRRKIDSYHQKKGSVLEYLQ